MLIFRRVVRPSSSVTDCPARSGALGLTERSGRELATGATGAPDTGVATGTSVAFGSDATEETAGVAFKLPPA